MSLPLVSNCSSELSRTSSVIHSHAQHKTAVSLQRGPWFIAFVSPVPAMVLGPQRTCCFSVVTCPVPSPHAFLCHFPYLILTPTQPPSPPWSQGQRSFCCCRHPQDSAAPLVCHEALYLEARSHRIATYSRQTPCAIPESPQGQHRCRMNKVFTALTD